MIASIKAYVVGGVAIAALLFVGWILWLNGSLKADLSASEAARIEATSQRDLAIEANQKNTEALATLARYRALDNQLVTELQSDMAKLDRRFSDLKSERDQLKRTNPDVKNFLDTPIPAALRMSREGSGSN